MLSFYCKDCKTEFDAPKRIDIPRVTDPTKVTKVYICPTCKGQNWTEVVDGEILEETEGDK